MSEKGQLYFGGDIYTVDEVCPEAEAVAGNEHTGDKKKKEIGGRDGPDPTRYGDWEKNGRCIDF